VLSADAEVLGKLRLGFLTEILPNNSGALSDRHDLNTGVVDFRHLVIVIKVAGNEGGFNLVAAAGASVLVSVVEVPGRLDVFLLAVTALPPGSGGDGIPGPDLQLLLVCNNPLSPAP